MLPSRLPLLQFQRFRGKINIQRPRKPHYERAKVLAVTAPQYPEPPKTLTCFQSAKERLQKNVENPYNEIIAREVRNWLKHSKMVAVFHMNSINSDDMFRLRVELHKQNMHLKVYGRQIWKQAISNTDHEAMLPLFENSHCVIFSSEQKVPLLLRLTRKTPQLLLLAGIVDNTLLSRNEFIAYSQLPGLQAVQAELVHTLNTAACNVVQNLEAHQNNFVNILDVYAKSDETEQKKTEEASEASST